MTGTITKIFSFLLALAQLLMLYLPFMPRQRLILDADTSYQTFTGWGTSGAWWAQEVGNSANDEWVAKLLFDDTEGLGLNIYRYNVGGGEWENPQSRIWEPTRKTESFYVWDEAVQGYVFDFSRDANARRMLDLALENGAEQIILFCNSPHFSMTKSGHASGGLEENVSNLPRENYQVFVDYLLTIADHFVSLGYPITAISPINEPQWGWGGDWVGQEGCHFEIDEAIELLELFAQTMQQRGAGYGLNGPESGQLNGTYTQWQKAFFGSEILKAYCDTFSGHSYWMDNDTAGKAAAGRNFAKDFPGKGLEMSEWCELPCTLHPDSIESALYTANIIAQDLTLLNAVSWQSWVAVNGEGMRDDTLVSDGLLRAAGNDYNNLIINRRYYALKHFSASIPAGAKRIALRDSFGVLSKLTCAAFRNGDTIILIVLNNHSADIRVSLAGLADKTAQMTLTTTDASRNYEQAYAGSLPSSFNLRAQSINTIVIG